VKKLAGGVVKGVASVFKMDAPEVEIPESAQTPAQGYETAERAQSDDNISRRKRRSRNSLRIDANIAGDNGAGGNGLNIPR
jgi:hypothetical protein